MGPHKYLDFSMTKDTKTKVTRERTDGLREKNVWNIYKRQSIGSRIHKESFLGNKRAKYLIKTDNSHTTKEAQMINKYIAAESKRGEMRIPLRHSVIHQIIGHEKV